MTAEELRMRLTRFVDYRTGARIRKKLHKLALKNYRPEHDPKEYLMFMNSHFCGFTINGSQSTNHPYYMTLFTVVSQHVMGDCVEECLDKAMIKRGSHEH